MIVFLPFLRQFRCCSFYIINFQHVKNDIQCNILTTAFFLCFIYFVRFSYTQSYEIPDIIMHFYLHFLNVLLNNVWNYIYTHIIHVFMYKTHIQQIFSFLHQINYDRVYWYKIKSHNFRCFWAVYLTLLFINVLLRRRYSLTGV